MNRISLLTSALILLMIMGCSRNGAKQYLFIGTYTGEASQGIYVYSFDPETGTVDSIGAATGVKNPSYLALANNGRNLYAVNEMADSAKASVSAFSFNKETGRLTFLNKQSSGGGAPCYVSVDKNGKTVFVGNYVGGSLSAFPIKDDGSLKKASVTITHNGSSINKARQKSPHVHCTIMGPDNEYLFVTDLGTDKVQAYNYSSAESFLSTEASFTFKTEAGAGPRHLTFHPNKSYAYLINELKGTVVAFHHWGDSLKAIQRVSTLPDGYSGQISGADIHVSPDGKFLYASNREDLNDIVIFKIEPSDGTLSYVGRQSSGGVHPRNFMITPGGRYLLAANRNSDNVVVFKRDKTTGKLTPTGTEIPISQPVCLKMTAIN